jgi:chromosome segregation ATPase
MALSKALKTEQDNLQKINSKIDEYNHLHQHLPKLLVDKTQQKQEVHSILSSLLPWSSSLDPSRLPSKEIDQAIAHLSTQLSALSSQSHSLHSQLLSLHTPKDPLLSVPEVGRARKRVENAERRKGVLGEGVEEARENARGIDEKLGMVKEDLTGKLLQRADLVAQREELEEMEEGIRGKYGNNFQRYWEMQEDWNVELERKYTEEKERAFYIDILKQLQGVCENKEATSETESDGDSSFNHFEAQKSKSPKYNSNQNSK